MSGHEDRAARAPVAPDGKPVPASSPLARLLAPLRAIDRYWLAPAPAQRLAALRIVSGIYAVMYLLVRLPNLLSYARFHPQQFQPVGIVSMVLDRPLLPVALYLLVALTLAAAVAFLLGWRYRVSGPLCAVLLLWTLTYRNSWGMVFHTENLLVMHVLILGLVRAADAWSLDARRHTDTPAPHGKYGWPARLMCWVVVIAYVLAGVAKLRNAGMDWLWGDELRNHIALDNGRKVLLGDVYSPIAVPLLSLGWLFRGFALMTLIAELGAPLALLGRRIAALWVVLVVGFHWGVLALMMIGFPYPMFGFAFACFFPIERGVQRVRDRYQRWRAARAERGQGGE